MPFCSILDWDLYIHCTWSYCDSNSYCYYAFRGNSKEALLLFAIAFLIAITFSIVGRTLTNMGSKSKKYDIAILILKNFAILFLGNK